MKNFNIKIITILILLFVVSFSCSKSEINDDNEQQEEVGDNSSGLTLVDQVSLGSSEGDYGTGIVASRDGYIVCGITKEEQAYLVAVDKDLNSLWEKTIGTGISALESIIKCSNGNYVAIGFTQTVLGGNDFDLYAIKIDELGNTIWEKSYGVNSITDTTMHLAEAPNGDIVLVGNKLTPPITDDHVIQDISVTRIDSNGNLVWNKIFGGSLGDSATSVLVENNGDIWIGGTTASIDGNISNPKGESDIWIIKVSPTGELLQEKSFGSSEGDFGGFLHKLKDGHIAVIGVSDGEDKDVMEAHKGEGDVWLFILDAALNITNQTRIGGKGYDVVFSLVEAKNNTFFLAGSTNSHMEDPIFGKDDLWVLKLASNLEVLDEITYGGAGFEFGAHMILNEMNQAVVLGSTESSDGDVKDNNGDYDIWLTLIEDIE
ncbi:MAG: hypothetical protein ACON5F_02370 [Jejuia sp.]